MKYDKKKAIEIIVFAAERYKEYLQDKVFLIIYIENGVTKTVQVEFRDSHFLHLTGVFTKLSAKRFYEKCLNKKLSLDDFELDKSGNTKATLSVGFRYGKNADFPVTLYKEEVRKLSHPTNKVLAIFRRDYNQEKYTECTYLSKGQKIDKLQIDESMKKFTP